MPQGRSRSSSSKRPDTYMYLTPAWQVAGGTNLQMSFPLNCGQRFSMPQRSFRAQQRLGGLLASWMRKRLCSAGGRPLMMMIHLVFPNSTACNKLLLVLAYTIVDLF